MLSHILRRKTCLRVGLLCMCACAVRFKAFLRKKNVADCYKRNFNQTSLMFIGTHFRQCCGAHVGRCFTNIPEFR